MYKLLIIINHFQYSPSPEIFTPQPNRNTTKEPVAPIRKGETGSLVVFRWLFALNETDRLCKTSFSEKYVIIKNKQPGTYRLLLIILKPMR
ncbi:MAG: hypothetical protein KA807_01410 [Prolixibacteraceae bacterium]|nr:hypothetical protein [Prolixibacteraceae bacterium]